MINILILILIYLIIFLLSKKELFTIDTCNICDKNNNSLNVSCLLKKNNYTFYKCHDGSVYFKIPYEKKDNSYLIIYSELDNKCIKQLVSDNNINLKLINNDSNSLQIYKLNPSTSKIYYTLNWYDDNVIKSSNTIKLEKNNKEQIKNYPTINEIIYNNLKGKNFYINL